MKTPARSYRLVLCLAALCALLMSASACRTAVNTVTGSSDANVGQSLNQSGKISRKELAQKMRRLAMSYLGEVPGACETIASDKTLSIDMRVLAMQIRANSSDSVISIAADPDPQVSLLNMVSILTLQRMMAEDRAEEFFGESGQLYVKAAQRMEDEGWKLAEQVLSEQDITQLKELIAVYRKDNPDDVAVWWTRFSEFSGYREQFSVAGVGQGIVDVFVPVGGAVQGLDTTNDVAERATWLAARQALIIQWRVELTYLQTLSNPETIRVLEDIEKVSETIANLPEEVAAERRAILEALDDQQSSLRQTIDDANTAVDNVKSAIDKANTTVGEVNTVVDNARGAIADVQATIEQGTAAMDKAEQILPNAESTLAQLEKTSDSLNNTLQTVGAIAKEMESDPDAPPGRPFDITEYTAALQEAGTTLQELNTVLASVDKTAEPTRLDATLDTLEGRFSALIWQAGFVVVAVGLILIIAAKFIPVRKRVVAA